MNVFSQQLRERIAQQAPLRYNADELKRMREQAVEREPEYRRRLAEINDKLRHDRFRKRSQHTIFCGYTSGYSKEGPGQLVFIQTDKHNNKCFQRRSRSGKLERVNACQIIFKFGFDEYIARTVAGQKFNQARALESLELSGGMSKSEAVMAARHRSAWKAAVSMAKDKGIYVGDDVELTRQDDLDAQAAGLQIFENYKMVYARADLQRDAVCHAISFYRTWHVRFPDGWSPDNHLDFWVLRYCELMTHHRGVLAGTIDEINHRSHEHVDAIVSIAKDVMKSPRLADFQQHIINSRNYRKVECLSHIAREDAMPPEYIHGEHYISEPPATYNYSGDRMMHTNDEVQYQEPVTQPFGTPPDEFTHWDSWFRVFCPDSDSNDLAQVSYNSPRVSLADKPYDPEEPMETQSIKIKLRQIELRFAQWPDDVLVFLALDKIRLAAVAGDYEEMCLLTQRVNMMMGVQDADADEDVIEVDEMPQEEDNVADDLFEELARAEESEEGEEEEGKVVADDSDEEDDDTAMRY
jgi:hypothetical protein